jgi:Ser/Thr protein kinase RdoA (MazF antagonist)
VRADAPAAFAEAHLRPVLAAWGLEAASISPLPGGASGEVFLIETDEQRFVAKHAYMRREDFEPGLHAAEAVARSTDLAAAAPIPTLDGDLVVMVPHNGYEHPVAVMEWVQGEHVPVDTVAAASELGRVLGSVQAVLAGIPASALGLAEDRRAFLTYLRSRTQDLGEHRWLHDRIGGIVADIDAMIDAEMLTFVCGVWDGPERVRDERGRIGLVDFGNTAWYPAAHIIGYGTSQVRVGAEADEAPAIDSFIRAFLAEYAVSDADLAAVGLFRLATVATYAKFMARRAATGQLPKVMRVGFERVLAELNAR